MRHHESSISSRQMCHVMRQITGIHKQVASLETEAKTVFSRFSTLGQKLNPIKVNPPLRYAKFSSDPLFDICDYPLFSHLLMLGLTEGLTRVLHRRRGFKRGKVGDVGYWVRIPSALDAAEADKANGDEHTSSFSSHATPLVFVHGENLGARLQAGVPHFPSKPAGRTFLTQLYHARTRYRHRPRRLHLLHRQDGRVWPNHLPPRGLLRQRLPRMADPRGN